MAVQVAHLANLEVAQRDARKAARCRPVGVGDQVADDVEAVQVIVGAEEAVQHEQLADHVSEIEHFRRHV